MMTPSRSFWTLSALWMLVTTPAFLGCTKSPTPSAGDSSPTDVPPSSNAASANQTLANAPSPAVGNPADSGAPALPLPIAEPLVDLPLPESDSPADLLNFLQKTDRAAQDLYRSGAVNNPEDFRQRMLAISRRKQQAADKLIQLADAPPESLKRAKQAKLEALSQQVGLQDANAAKALEAYADELTNSQDARLQYSARVVKLGFLVDRFTNSQSADPDQLVTSVKELVVVPQLIDLASAGALRNVYDVLIRYGYDGAAFDARALIVKAFKANGADFLLQMAQELEAVERFDELTGLQRNLVDGKPVSPVEIQTVATSIAKRFPDLGTLHYLNSSALNLEATGRDEHAAVLYDVIAGTLASGSEASIAAEAVAVAQARKNRQQVIGQPIRVNSNDVNGVPIDWPKYAGQVVIIPFWSLGGTMGEESLPLLLLVQRLVEENPGKVAALGINLDPPDAPVLRFLQETRIRFTSARQSDPSLQGLNDPLARQAGVASLPFVLLVDPQGKAAHVVLDISRLEATVQALVKAE